MNRNKPQPLLDAPIPGMSMTAELGGRPWQQPAKYKTPDEALEYYVNKITNPEMSNRLLDVLELGMPVDTLVDSIQVSGVMEGLHSVDVGVIISPALTETIHQMAKAANVEHTVIAEPVDKKETYDTEVSLALANNEKDVMLEEPTIKQPMKTEEPSSGLMSRRVE
jgi:hypothetical protein